MKLRLLLRGDCNRSCAGCCNKTWDLEALPICTDYSKFSEVMLTGGEPMLDYKQVIQTARIVRAQNPTVPIFVYTAKTEPSHELGWVLSNVDGVTITIHEEKDIEPFLKFARYADLWKLWKCRSLRVNVFKPMKLPVTFELRHWVIKDQMEWIVNCPLPQDEVFMRTELLTTPHTTMLNWTGKK